MKLTVMTSHGGLHVPIFPTRQTTSLGPRHAGATPADQSLAGSPPDLASAGAPPVGGSADALDDGLDRLASSLGMWRAMGLSAVPAGHFGAGYLCVLAHQRPCSRAAAVRLAALAGPARTLKPLSKKRPPACTHRHRPAAERARPGSRQVAVKQRVWSRPSGALAAHQAPSAH